MLLLLTLMGCKNDQDLNLLREPPVVAIAAPVTGSLLTQDIGELALEGNVSDFPDAPDTLLVRWTLDGATIGTDPADSAGRVAGALDISTIEPGTYVIGLEATDSDDTVGHAQVSVEIVAPPSAPDVTITAPESGSAFETTDAITFTGQATDVNDAGDDLVFAWTSSIDGPIPGATSGGGLSYVTSTLSDGEHQIVLSVTDTDGEVGSDDIVVTVGEPTTPETRDPDPGEVIFSELMVNPSAVDDEVGEWVELYNTGDEWLDIGGYSFHDLDYDQYTLTGSIPVEPYGYVVLCASLDPGQNGGASCDAWFSRQVSGGLALANVPDEVVLTRPDGVEIDRLVYADDWVASGAAIGLDPGHMDGVQNDDFGNWCFQTTTMSGGDEGTPGSANDPCP